MNYVVSETLRQRRVTRREAEVLEALQGHLSNPEIADLLVLSRRTVESHVASLMRKLAASDRHELAHIAQELLGTAPSN